MSPPPLNALLISDGKPGHYHQAEGVVAALARLRPVSTTRLAVQRRLLVPTRTLLQLTNAGQPAARLLRFGYGIRASELPPADIVVSAGGETLAANAAAAKVLGAANIFCGRLRRLAPEHVGLVLVTLDSLALAPNYLVCLPPSPMDVAGASAAARGARRFGRDAPPARVGLLIGGNSGAFRYREGDWLALTGSCARPTASTACACSPPPRAARPTCVGDALAAMAAEPDGRARDLHRLPHRGPGHARAHFRGADAVICTDDSTSMISEAVGACMPLVAVTPQSSKLEPREAEYRKLARDPRVVSPAADREPDAGIASRGPGGDHSAHHQRPRRARRRHRRPTARNCIWDGARCDACRSAADRRNELQDGDSQTLAGTDQAGGGPNTSTALRPPNANEFDMA